MNVLVTGGNGYIARSLVNTLGDKYNITSVTRDNFDLTDPVATSNWLRGMYFDVVLHTAIVGGNRMESDTQDVIDKNLTMYYNLLSNRSHYGRFINFGSGAEQFQKDTPYGISKKIIADSVTDKENFYNIRIFGIFDEHELDRRFIKSNVIRYIKKEPMILHCNKVMDFFYMEDFVNVVKYYIENDVLSKSAQCCYREKYTLKGIADMINNLSDHTVPIIVEDDEMCQGYFGETILPPIDTKGIEYGIRKTYDSLSDIKELQ